jgi:flagellar biosynthesis GTPase FlhF
LFLKASTSTTTTNITINTTTTTTIMPPKQAAKEGGSRPSVTDLTTPANAMSHYNDKRDYFLELWLESEDTQDELLNWAKEQFVKSGQADAAREQAKREVKQQVEDEIKASPHKMAGLERGLKRKLEREIRSDPAKLARVHEMIRIRELIPDIEKAIRDRLEAMDEE